MYIVYCRILDRENTIPLNFDILKRWPRRKIKSSINADAQ